MTENKDLLITIIAVVFLVCIGVIIYTSTRPQEIRCPEIVIPECKCFINASDYLPMTNNECEEYGYILPTVETTLEEPSITCLNQNCTDYITTIDSPIIPTFHGDFKTESNSDPDKIVGDGKGDDWPCEPDNTFLFDAKEYVYRSTDWFGESQKGNAEDACKSKTPHLEHWFLTTEYPLSKAGYNQTQYRLLKCWNEVC